MSLIDRATKMMDQLIDDHTAHDCTPPVSKLSWLLANTFIWLIICDLFALALMGFMGLVSTIAAAIFAPGFLEHPSSLALTLFWSYVIIPPLVILITTTVLNIHRYRHSAPGYIGEQLRFF